jgi:hypothetical protein
MSVHVWSWVLKHSPAGDRDVGSSPLDRLVLLVLADHAHGDGTGSHPDEVTIAKESRGKKRSVYYALDALEAAGCIVQTGVTAKGVREWQVLMTDAAASAKFAHRPTRKRRQQAVQTTTDGGAKFAEPSANGDTQRAHELIKRPLTAQLTVLEPPSGARVREGSGEGAESNGHHQLARAEAPATLKVPAGASPRTEARLRRTAERTGARLIYEGRHQR